MDPRLEDAVTLEGVIAALTGPDPTARVVRSILRTHQSSLTNTQRVTIAKRVFGVSCLRARLAYLCGSEVPRDLLAAYIDSSSLVPRPWPGDDVGHLVVRCSLPRWMATHFHTELGLSATISLFETVNEPGPVTVRCNKDSSKIEGTPGRFAPYAVILSKEEGGHKPNIWGNDAWRNGQFEVMDEGSQLIALACSPLRPTDKIVDLCAGRGGKTLALADTMGGDIVGEIWAVDVDPKALADIGPRKKRAGNLRHVKTLLLPTNHAEGEESCAKGAMDCLGNADVVLVDAPCSSLGTLRRGPDVRWTMLPSLLTELPSLQKKLMRRAWQVVRPGGCVVYATCTLARAENEDVVDYAVTDLGFVPEPLSEAWGIALSEKLGITPMCHSVTLLPHVHGTDGFFMARFRKPR